MSKLIVGLGNPGKEYTTTRHNVGFLVLDELARKIDARFSPNKKLRGDVSELNLNGEKIILLKPSTFMNLSGEAVQKVVDKYKIELSDVWVVHDDVDLDFGVLRIRKDGSAGGHNGLKSIIKMLGSEEFVRIRIGVGATPERMALEDWVLSKFGKDEIEELDKIKTSVVDKILKALRDGIDAETVRV